MAWQADIASRLKQTTAREHQQTEDLLAVGRAMTGSFSVEDYQRLAATNYLVWTGFLANWPRESADAWIGYRSLVEQIAAAASDELRHRGQPLPQATRAYPPPANPAAFAGSLYVHLGSLLGGKVIWQALNRADQLISCQPFRFYAAGGDFAGADWRRFQQLLPEQLVSEAELQQAVEQAKRVFVYYREVFAALEQAAE